MNSLNLSAESPQAVAGSRRCLLATACGLSALNAEYVKSHTYVKSLCEVSHKKIDMSRSWMQKVRGQSQVSCVDIVVSDKYRQVQRKRPIYSQKRTTVHKRDPDTTISMDMWIRLYMGLFCVLWSSFANIWVSFVELVYTYPIDVSFV